LEGGSKIKGDQEQFSPIKIGLILGGITLEQVESYRYLGVMVSSRLTWSDHIKHVCAKARKLVGMLYSFIAGMTPKPCCSSVGHA